VVLQGHSVQLAPVLLVLLVLAEPGTAAARGSFVVVE
jgi:hypothetical protein